jgi:hypothetical protein
VRGSLGSVLRVMITGEQGGSGRGGEGEGGGAGRLLLPVGGTVAAVCNQLRCVYVPQHFH